MIELTVAWDGRGKEPGEGETELSDVASLKGAPGESSGDIQYELVIHNRNDR